MKKSIASLYAEYGRYIDVSRAIPYSTDCLKPIEKRILYVINKIAKTKTQKCGKIIGDVMGGYHPHGDMSIYGTLVRMVNDGYLTPQGNFGSPGYLNDSPPSAYRYTEAKSNKELNDLFGEFLKFVDYVQSEADEYEPEYLPSPIPIGLIGDRLITGIGFHTTAIPTYKFTDLLKRLLYLIDKENNDKIIISPKVRGCDVYELYKNKSFEEILTTGKGQLWANPKYKLYSNKLMIYGRHPTIGFTKLRNFNENYQTQNNEPYFMVQDDCGKDINITITPYRGSQITQQFLDKVYGLLKGKINVRCNVVDKNSTVSLIPIDDMLLTSYYSWGKVWNKKLKNDLNNVQQKLKEIDIIEVIREIITNNPSFKSTTEILDEFKNNYSKNKYNFGVTEMEEVINRYNIKKLIEFKLDKTKYNKEFNDIKNTISNLGQISIDRIKTYIKSNPLVNF